MTDRAAVAALRAEWDRLLAPPPSISPSDWSHLVARCVAAHDQQHIIGIREFEQRWDVSLKTIARQLTAIYEAEKFPCP